MFIVGIAYNRISIIILLVIIVIPVISPLICYTESETPKIAITGSFYKYEYVLAPNTTISGKDIYVAIFNTADKPINVSLGYEAPDFIEIIFSQQNATILPGEHKIVYIRIRALPNAIPGEYEVKVYANIIMKTVEGKVILVPGAGQRTTIRIVGPTGRLIAETIDKEGNHVTTEIRVLRITTKGEYTVTSNKSGYINISLPPGKYIVRATLAGEMLAEEKVVIEENKTERVFLTVSTVWFDYFDVLPYYRDKNIVFAEIIGVVKNVYKAINNVSIILVVNYNDRFLENVTIASIPILPQGRAEYKYRYIPMNGWQNGTYMFKLVMVSGTKVYSETSEKLLNVTTYKVKEQVTKIKNMTTTITVNKSTATTITTRGRAGFNYWLLVIIIILVIVAVIVLAMKRKG